MTETTPTPTGPRTFEEILAIIARLVRATGSGQREIAWLGGARMLAVARDEDGAVEIYVSGSELSARLVPVARVLRHDTWTDGAGDPFRANRLRLDTGAHLDPVAAAICTQLLSARIETEGGRDSAFAESEPIIALALERVQESNAVLVGLAGELVALRSLILARPSRATALAEAWAGYMPSTRDLQLKHVGVEVKTTTGDASAHHIQGTHQVDLGTSVGGEPETHLYLLSIGITWLPMADEHGHSITSLIEEIEQALDDVARSSFGQKVSQYGGAASATGAAAAGTSDSPWDRPFYTRFIRLYDLTDPAIRVLHGDVVAEQVHVDPASVTYRVILPRQVTGTVNPINGAAAVTQHLLELSGI
jgi:hypothetical protein